jgi:nitroreductase
MTAFNETEIKKAIIRSQHCQRNWDLTKQIPKEHLEVLKTSITQSPSLQNVAFYKIHWIQDRETIEKVHACTHGAPYKNTENGKKVVDPHPREEDHLHDMGDTTQSQTLANLVVVFEKYFHVEEYFKEKRVFNTSHGRKVEHGGDDFDAVTALGIASGYLNLTASLLGYQTGCCISFQHSKLKETLNLEGEPLLIMGVGFKDPKLSRRIHQTDHNVLYPTNPRQEVPVVEYN